ncbi:bifunctional sulfate adenylyltransferase/adenylylsulfate kinase [Pseudomonas sp. 6D_7.1_Bac1]|uniref:bifunctional sulfate adenylyltransferase/adenylylsulfate kinase n=1 Tax=Pseudomonas sp. 6D_7.1_Bac1 TaxID=2971615 RepID=UPI0021C603C3|nr:bifunctional sulfate adenylyltransferase/adenylylsulfate kinase [Pseudomonas sp. 6D_7.1_Bac1]MCU1750201.1 bifunctional sulfate adenylyltransferase/adenylylsulfate kinase [Pseudomonas sp. 6D_7.1_Bac1]
MIKPIEKLRVSSLPFWILSARQLCDLELILNGAFSPLTGFLGEDDYACVVRHMRLTSGALWPIPITLDIPQTLALELTLGAELALRDPEGVTLAVLTVDSIYQPDHDIEALEVLGTLDRGHPGVAALYRQHRFNVGGRLKKVEPITHYDFTDLRLSPIQVRDEIARRGWETVVAFQTRNPMHRAHVELTQRAMKQVNAALLLQPVVGLTKPDDIDYYTRVRCYKHALKSYAPDVVLLSLLPLAMRMGGPREAIWHALIRKNFGATHFIVGRDHAGPGNDMHGKAFYAPYAAQEMALEHAQEIGLHILAFEEMLYLAQEQRYVPASQVPPGADVLSLSGTAIREKLASGAEIPNWFSAPDIVAELRQSYRPKQQQGFVLFFTGLSGAGKSTIANGVAVRLREGGGRVVSLLDGDVVRQKLSKGLGFSKADRETNVERIGFVAVEIARAGGVALCACISPYASTRQVCRELAMDHKTAFFEIYLATNLEVCEQRDRKGLYAKARAGELKGMTGIDAPYEPPLCPDLQIDTACLSVNQSVELIISSLIKLGYLPHHS